MPYTPKDKNEKEEILARIEQTVMASGFQDGVERGIRAGLEAAAQMVDDLAKETERKMRQARIAYQEREETLDLFRLIAACIRKSAAERPKPNTA